MCHLVGPSNNGCEDEAKLCSSPSHSLHQDIPESHINSLNLPVQSCLWCLVRAFAAAHPLSSHVAVGKNGKPAPPIRRTIDKQAESKGSGKKGKSEKHEVPQKPLALGCVGVTNKGNALCYDFQLGKCGLTVQNMRCPKGICAQLLCHRDCPARDWSKAKKGMTV